MEPYSHNVLKFSDAGLQLRLPVDAIPPGQYGRIRNALPVIEGRLETRAGLTLVASLGSSPIHSLYRLNQQIPSILGERLVGIASELWSASLAVGAAFAQLTGLAFDGQPLSIIDFRFTNDEAAWAIIGNGNGMRKRRRPSLYQALGQLAPTVAASGADAGVGNLSNGAGPGYDWRYTYMNSITRTESNGSPIAFTAPGTQRPTSQTNPDASFGGNACSNPASAYDNNNATFAEMVADSALQTSQSCRFTAWQAGGGAGTAGSQLFIDSEVILSETIAGLAVYVYYSVDAGVTWTQVYTTNSTRARTTDVVTLPASTDTSRVLVRAAAIFNTATGGGGGVGGGGGGGSTARLNIE